MISNHRGIAFQFPTSEHISSQEAEVQMAGDELFEGTREQDGGSSAAMRKTDPLGVLVNGLLEN
jgi:hypothetical protein